MDSAVTSTECRTPGGPAKLTVHVRSATAHQRIMFAFCSPSGEERLAFAHGEKDNRGTGRRAASGETRTDQHGDGQAFREAWGWRQIQGIRRCRQIARGRSATESQEEDQARSGRQRRSLTSEVVCGCKTATWRPLPGPQAV